MKVDGVFARGRLAFMANQTVCKGFNMAHCLLALDLKSVEDKQRREFYAQLKNDGWEKMADVDTTWKQFYSGLTYESGVERRLHVTLETAAKLAEVERVYFAIQIGDHAARGGSVVLEWGTYHFSIG